MIFKNQRRGHSTELAMHLGSEENEQVKILYASKDVARFDHMGLSPAEELRLILSQFDLKAAALGKTQNHLDHAMNNPEIPLDELQTERTWQAYDNEYGYQDCMTVVVGHLKDGEWHTHKVTLALNEKGHYINNSHDNVRNEKLSRILEHEFGHPATKGAKNKAVHSWLKNHNQENVAKWMEENGLLDGKKPVAKFTYKDKVVSDSTGLEFPLIKQFVEDCYKKSDTGQAFEAALSEMNLLLTRGDRESKRGRAGRFVIVDASGTAYALNRCGVKVKDVQEKFTDLKYEHLLATTAVQEEIKNKSGKDEEQQKTGGSGDDGYFDFKQAIEELRQKHNKHYADQQSYVAKMKAIDRQIGDQKTAIWKDYHSVKAPLQLKIDRVYDRKKDRLKAKYKPKWKKLFRKQSADHYRRDKSALSLLQKTILMVRYIPDISEANKEKGIGKYLKFMVSRRKQDELITARHKKEKDALFEAYKQDCAKLRQRVKSKAKEQKIIDQAYQKAKKESDKLYDQQQHIRETNKLNYKQLKNITQHERKELRRLIDQKTGKRTLPPPSKINWNKVGQGRDHENERER